MNNPAFTTSEKVPYYGWVNVVVAAIAMTATLPGRTHGLGLITEPMLLDMNISRVTFSQYNFFGAIIGASFCVPVGWWIDRSGVRGVLSFSTLALGLSVIAMSYADHWVWLLCCLVLARGFGQSALSLASIAVISKWFSRGLGPAMGIFAVLLTFGFIASVLTMGTMIEQLQWRMAWRELGYAIVLMAPVFWLLVRDSPVSLSTTDAKHRRVVETPDSIPWTLGQAARTPSFWTLVSGCCAFNLVWSSVTLFNESILIERGVAAGDSVQIMAILTGVGLIANLIAGPLASRDRALKLLGVGLAFLAFGLVALQLVDGIGGARLYAIAIGLSGGIVTVVFFSAFAQLFGATQLGRIQGISQLATVVASACGPVLSAETASRFGSYRPLFFALAIVIGLIAVVAIALPKVVLAPVPTGQP